MSYIHTLSYTRAVSRKLNDNEDNISLFRGSSLTRKNAPKKHKEAEILIGSAIHASELQQEADNLHSDKEAELQVDAEGNLLSAAVETSEGRTHRLSQRTKTKIREKIFALYGACSGADFTFLTLTFISSTDDRTAQKCLNKFLTVLRQQYGRFLYIWVAERQQSGNIHFHFITNTSFPIKAINSLWVLQQYNAGITHQRYEYWEITALYDAQAIGKVFNPVDVRKIKNIEALSGYLTGYITKNNEEFNCSAWHCCRGVSALFTAQIVNENIMYEVCDKKLNSKVHKGKLYEAKTSEIINKETGITVAVVTNIVNKKHFKQHLTSLDALNHLVAGDYVTKQDCSETFVFNREKFAQFYYSKIHLN